MTHCATTIQATGAQQNWRSRCAPVGTGQAEDGLDSSAGGYGGPQWGEGGSRRHWQECAPPAKDDPMMLGAPKRSWEALHYGHAHRVSTLIDITVSSK